MDQPVEVTGEGGGKQAGLPAVVFAVDHDSEVTTIDIRHRHPTAQDFPVSVLSPASGSTPIGKSEPEGAHSQGRPETFPPDSARCHTLTKLTRLSQLTQEGSTAVTTVSGLVPVLVTRTHDGNLPIHCGKSPLSDTSVARSARFRLACTFVRTLLVDHPLVAHKLATLRDAATESPTFRLLADELVTLLAYEATRSVRTIDTTVSTPMAQTQGVRLARPVPLVVPILRAGLGMLEGMTRLLPTASVGFLGMVRDEDTLRPATYATRLPEDLSGRQCYVLDPMLATGGTLVAAVQLLLDRGADDITTISLLAAPEGLERMEQAFGDAQAPVSVVTAALDERLDENGFIVPGLGDAGDRMYGSV